MNRIDNAGGKQKTLRWILIAVNVIIPFLEVWIPLSVLGKKISDCIPVWGDELWWWQQANAVSVYGRPLGYWGYNGGTAAIGTFAAWGAFPVMPYGLFGAVFGWQYYSYIFANVFYQILGILFFICLTKPDVKALAFLTVINLTQIIRNAYLTIAMQESVRSAAGLVAAGLLIWIWNNRDNSGKKMAWVKGITGVYLLIAGQLYLIWTGFFLPFFLLIHRKTSWKLRFPLAAVETGVIIYFSRRLLNLTASPYIRAPSLSERVLSNLADFQSVLFSGKTAWFFRWYHGGMIVAIILILGYVWLKRKELTKDETIRLLSACAIPIAFLAGHIFFYDTTKWTFTRGMAMGIVPFAFACCLFRKKAPAVILSVWGCICLLLFYTGGIDSTFINEKRFATEDWENRIAETKEVLTGMRGFAEVGVSKDPWDYTLETYYISGNPVTLSVPVGFSINSMMDKKFRTLSKWIAIEKAKESEKAEKMINCFLDKNYVIVSQSETLVLLSR